MTNLEYLGLLKKQDSNEEKEFRQTLICFKSHAIYAKDRTFIALEIMAEELCKISELLLKKI